MSKVKGKEQKKVDKAKNRSVGERKKEEEKPHRVRNIDDKKTFLIIFSIDFRKILSEKLLAKKRERRKRRMESCERF